MAVTEFGLSTLGVKFGWAVGTSKPSSYTQLERITSIGEISNEPETIDVSALEDYISHFVAGRGTITDTLAIGVLFTDETMDQWEAVLTAYAAMTAGQQMWFMVSVEGLSDAAYINAAPPATLPMPSLEQNSAFTATINLTVKDYNWDTKGSF